MLYNTCNQCIYNYSNPMPSHNNNNHCATTTTTTTRNKKKRGSLSKKEKASKQGDNAHQSQSQPLSATILLRILIGWILLGIGGFIAYWKTDPLAKMLKANEERIIQRQKREEAFTADVVGKGNRNRKRRRDHHYPNPNTIDGANFFNNNNKKNHNAKTTTAEELEFTVNEEQLWDPPDPRIEALLSHACLEMYCHESLRVVGRSFRTIAPIEVGVKLYEIPRSMQIWDLDAYRDPYVRKHLFKASHKISGNRMGTEAFLAAFLALEIKRAELNPSNFDHLRLLYFDSLPTLEEFEAYHPILADKNAMGATLGPRSLSHSILQGYRNMIKSEYEGFTAGSSDFASTVSKDEYLRARMAVLTRALNVGPPGPEEVMPAAFLGDEFRDQDLFLDELYSYYDLINVNLTEAGGQGCIAMVPIADLFNHHPNSNTELQYKKMQTHPETQQKSGRSFVVSSINRAIGPYTEPMASYGFIADAHLYARYGFVNGDGSGPIQLSLGFHHEIMKLNISNHQYDYLPDRGTTEKFRNFQKRGLVKYLQFDDGYPECNSGPSSHPDEAELKRLKLQHLLGFANDYDRWNMIMEPRNPESLPARSTEIPIMTNLPQFRKDYAVMRGVDRLQETCRFVSIVNGDFDGNALAVLRDNVGNPDFRIGPGVSDALEFRSLMCMSRWFGTRFMSMELQGNFESAYRGLLAKNRDEFGSNDWVASHVRFGEMQALQAASGLVFERVSESWESKKIDPEPEYRMKDDICPEEYLDYLFRDDGFVPDISDLR